MSDTKKDMDRNWRRGEQVGEDAPNYKGGRTRTKLLNVHPDIMQLLKQIKKANGKTGADLFEGVVLEEALRLGLIESSGK